MSSFLENKIVEVIISDVFITVFSGVLVFIMSQFLLRLVLEPIIKYKKTIAKIDNKLKFYSNIICNPSLAKGGLFNDYFEAKNVLRELSCELESNYKTIPFKLVLIFMNLILSRENISDAATDLIWLSNTVGQQDETGTINIPILSSEKMETIRGNLKIT